MVFSSRKVTPAIFIACLFLCALFLFPTSVSADDTPPADPQVSTEVGPELPADETWVSASPLGESTNAAIPVQETPAPDLVGESQEDGEPQLALPQELTTDGQPPTRDSGLGVVPDDPYFTVGSITYHFLNPGGDCTGISHCFVSITGHTPVQDALDYMRANNLTPTDRKLFLEPGSYTGDVLVDGSLPGVKGLLTIHGTGPTPEAVTIEGGVKVTKMVNGFTISNLSVNSANPNSAAIWVDRSTGTINVVDVVTNNSAEDGAGILIDQKGSVNLNRVTSNDNGYSGARIYSKGQVKITNSEFDGNLVNTVDGIPGYDNVYDPDGNLVGTRAGYSGLEIYSDGAVIINGVSISNNTGDGLNVTAPKANITINNSIFNNNDVDGLVEDWGDGIWLEGQIISLTNIEAIGNDIRGMAIFAYSSVKGSNLWAESNLADGIFINACMSYLDEDPYCDILGAGNVTLTSSQVDLNGLTGVFINAKGSINLHDVAANSNGDEGFLLFNGASVNGSSINLTHVNANNCLNGIWILGVGPVTVNDFSAMYNYLDGLYIESYGGAPVTLTNVGMEFNETAFNGNNGYTILTMGAVTIINTDTYSNGGIGANIDNSIAYYQMPVIIKVNVPFRSVNGIINNGKEGIRIRSIGKVTVSDALAESNGKTGMVIDNTPPEYYLGAEVYVTASSFSGNLGENGLTIYSWGYVNLQDISAFGNHGYGVLVLNSDGGKGVTLTCKVRPGNFFWDNGRTGLEIITAGTISITNINAFNNDESGVNLDNTSGVAPVIIIKTGAWGANPNPSDPATWGNSFSGSTFSGLFIRSRSTVQVIFDKASQNGDNGIFIFSADGIGAVDIKGSLSGGKILENGKDGLAIFSQGKISLSNIESSSNFYSGAFLDNRFGSGTIILKQVNFSYNRHRGAGIFSKSTIVLIDGVVLGNWMEGIILDNLDSTYLSATISVENFKVAGNGNTGLTLLSKQMVKLIDVESNNNSSHFTQINYKEKWVDVLSENQTWFFIGKENEIINIQIDSIFFDPKMTLAGQNGVILASAESSGGSLHFSFTLPDDGDAIPNEAGDFHILIGSNSDSLGKSYSILLYNGSTIPVFTQKTSNSFGILVNTHEGTNAPVIIKNSRVVNISMNSGAGVFIEASGPVSISNGNLDLNKEDGIYIDNTYSTTTAGITLSGLSLSNNNGNGAVLFSNGPINLTGLDLVGNKIDGLYIKNNTGISSVVLTSLKTSTNGNNGIVINSKGPVNLTKIISDTNLTDGIQVNTVGKVSFFNVNASANSGYGLNVITSSSFQLSTSSVGIGIFTGNKLDGIHVIASGPITLTNVVSNENGWRSDPDTILSSAYGIYLDNSSNLAGTAPIILTNVESSGNTVDGLFAKTTSAVTITIAQANENENNGINIIQVAGPVISPLVILAGTTTCENGAVGLQVNSLGNIITNKFTANNNGSHGVSLVNSSGTGKVEIQSTKGQNISNANGGEGTSITTKGVVNITGIGTSGNALGGLVVDNSNPISNASVTITNAYANNNGSIGFLVTSNQTVTIKTSWSVNNRNHGISITTPGDVFISNSGAICNDRSGMTVTISGLNKIFKLTSSSWHGNLRNPLPGDKNLVTNTTPIIL